MAYNGVGSGLVAKYQEFEMEIAFRTGIAPSSVGYILGGFGILVLALLVWAGILLV